MSEEKEPRRRLAISGWRTVAIGAMVAGTGIAALVAFHDPAAPASRFSVTSPADENAPAPAATGPLMAELLRCRSLPAGADDAACRKAWEINRRRFMGESRSYAPPAGTGQGR